MFTNQSAQLHFNHCVTGREWPTIVRNQIVLYIIVITATYGWQQFSTFSTFHQTGRTHQQVCVAGIRSALAFACYTIGRREPNTNAIRTVKWVGGISPKHTNTQFNVVELSHNRVPSQCQNVALSRYDNVWGGMADGIASNVPRRSGACHGGVFRIRVRARWTCWVLLYDRRMREMRNVDEPRNGKMRCLRTINACGGAVARMRSHSTLFVPFYVFMIRRDAGCCQLMVCAFVCSRIIHIMMEYLCPSRACCNVFLLYVSNVQTGNAHCILEWKHYRRSWNLTTYPMGKNTTFAHIA